MKRIAEAAVFVGLAVGLHLMIAMRVQSQEGADAGGAGGEALVTMKGAPPGTVEMIEQWETPPEAVTETQPPELQEARLTEVAPEVPVFPRVSAPPPAFPSMDLPDAMPDTASLPKIEMDVPPPPEPEAEPDPEPEPEVVEDQPEPEVQPEDIPEEVAEADPVEEQPDTTTPAVSKRPLARPQEVERAPEPEPTPRPEPRTQQARAGGAGGATQTAAGSGGSSQAGNSGSASERAATSGQQAKLASVWGGRIRARIERRKRFPNSARGQVGTVLVRVTVSADGRLLGASILRSSGVQAFDQAAVAAINSAGRLPPAPSGLNESQRSFDLPMSFGQ